jgi:chromosome partitioning protein
MFDHRNRLANDVSDQLKQHFGDKVYRTIIPRNVRLAEAPSFGAPAMHYDKSSVGPRPIWPWLARSCAARSRSPSRLTADRESI